jgi:hypothetical protein
LGPALALVVMLATTAGAEEHRHKTVSSPLARAQAFKLAGRCSGPIDGQIVIDGVSYRVSPDVRIFELGRGAVPRGTAYYDRVVTVTGLKWRETLVVYSVLVRPDAYSASGTVGVKEGSSPE